MATTLLTAGIACIVAAIVGGGLKAFVEVPALASSRRQNRPYPSRYDRRR